MASSLFSTTRDQSSSSYSVRLNCSHQNEKELMKHFSDNKITAINRDPLPRELNLFYTKNRGFRLLHITSKSPLLEKLSGHVLYDLQIIHIYPWYNNIIPIGDSIASKRVLRKISTGQVYYAPSSDSDFTDCNIIDKQTSTFRKPFESLTQWCKRYGYKLNRRWFSEQEFLEEIHN